MCTTSGSRNNATRGSSPDTKRTRPGHSKACRFMSAPTCWSDAAGNGGCDAESACEWVGSGPRIWCLVLLAKQASAVIRCSHATRIEFSGAIYHVMSRGVAQMPVYLGTVTAPTSSKESGAPSKKGAGSRTPSASCRMTDIFCARRLGAYCGRSDEPDRFSHSIFLGEQIGSR